MSCQSRSQDSLQPVPMGRERERERERRVGESPGNEVDVMSEGNKFKGDKFFSSKRFFLDGKLQVERWLILQ